MYILNMTTFYYTVCRSLGHSSIRSKTSVWKLIKQKERVDIACCIIKNSRKKSMNAKMWKLAWIDLFLVL